MLMQSRDDAVIAEIEAIGRQRALTDEESAQLERAIRSSGRKTQRPWLPRDDLALRRMIRKRKRLAEIAAELDRSLKAVGMRVARLRRLGKCGYLSPVGGRGRYERKFLKAVDMGLEA